VTATVLVILATAYAVAVTLFVVRRRRRRFDPPDEQAVEQILRSLAVKVRDFWHQESGHRGLNKDSPDPWLLHTQWTAASRALADPSTPAVFGSTADMKGLIETFYRLDPRRLLVIGPAGSGKSTLCVLLLLELLQTRAEGDATPVIFSMSSYDPRHHDLLDWLSVRLTEEYGIASVATSRWLLETGRVFPILDGLDEIPRRHRMAALGRIRATFHRERPVIVSCRTQEYEQALREGPVLPGAAVTVARELAFEDVLVYLRRSLANGPSYAPWERLFDRLAHGWGVLDDELAEARESGARPLDELVSWSVLATGAGLRGTRCAEAQAIWDRWSALVRIDDPDFAADGVSPKLLVALGDALTSPLMATLFTDLYGYAVSEDDDMFERLMAARPERIRETILDAAVDMMFHRRLPGSPWQNAERYLVFLARRLRLTDRTDLAWWELSGAVSPLVYGTVLGLLMGIAGWLTTTFAVDGMTGLEAGAELAVSGVVTGTFLSWLGPDRIAAFMRREPRDNPRFTRVSTALTVGVPMTLATAVPPALAAGPATGLAGGLVFGMLLGGVAALLGAGGPVRGPRWFHRKSRFWRGVGGGMLTGALAGFPLGLLLWLLISAMTPAGSTYAAERRSPLYGLAAVLLGLIIGVVLGGVSGALRWMQVPAPADDSASPRSLLRGDRRLVLGWGLLVAALPAALTLLAMPPETRIEGVTLIAVLALWVPIAVRTWPRYVIARIWLALGGDLPWRLMPFLAHAYDVTALRQVGGVYQFRHKELQEHLSGR
jgi:hypothetical protein